MSNHWFIQMNIRHGDWQPGARNTVMLEHAFGHALEYSLVYLCLGHTITVFAKTKVNAEELFKTNRARIQNRRSHLRPPQDQSNCSFQLRYRLSVSHFSSLCRIYNRLHSKSCILDVTNPAGFKMRRQFKQGYTWLRTHMHALTHTYAHTYACHHNAALIQPCRAFSFFLS